MLFGCCGGNWGGCGRSGRDDDCGCGRPGRDDDCGCGRPDRDDDCGRNEDRGRIPQPWQDYPSVGNRRENAEDDCGCK